MATFIFITKTRWDELPRLRHQLALLLADAGHNVIFFQKLSPPWRRRGLPRRVHARVTTIDYHELVHHKLRLLPPIHRLNAWLAARSIRAGLERLVTDPDALIVNFNYEYYFVRELMTSRRVITVINDDHIATALFGWRRPLEWALAKTCRTSDRVMVVSSPLAEQLERYCDPALFLPWADTAYEFPAPGPRDTLLFWGFVNDRLDFGLLEQLADEIPDYRILIVGPIQGSVGRHIESLSRRANVEFRPPSTLDELPIDRVLAGLIPYRTGSGRIDAIQLSNKALQLLARGLPLLISGMPRFIDASFVYRLHRGNEALSKVVSRVSKEFEGRQLEIKAFVAENSAAARLRQFMEIAKT